MTHQLVLDLLGHSIIHLENRVIVELAEAVTWLDLSVDSCLGLGYVDALADRGIVKVEDSILEINIPFPVFEDRLRTLGGGAPLRHLPQRLYCFGS